MLVFCGASPGRLPVYAETGRRFGQLIAERRLGVVYGGASIGMMGAVADGALAAGGEVIGVIPRGLLEYEIAHAGLTKLHVVETMHQRKALMASLSDQVVALPGGSGTLDELFELITWSQLGLHNKPIGLLEVADYWQPLLRFLEHAVTERFIPEHHFNSLLVERDPVVLLDRLAAHEPKLHNKWLDRRDGDQTVPNTRSPASPKPGRM